MCLKNKRDLSVVGSRLLRCIRNEYSQNNLLQTFLCRRKSKGFNLIKFQTFDMLQFDVKFRSACRFMPKGMENIQFL